MDTLLNHLLTRLSEVQQNLGQDADSPATGATRFADVLDSMDMVEFLMVIAEDFGVLPAAVEQCSGRRFGSVVELAGALHATGWELSGHHVVGTQVALATPETDGRSHSLTTTAWLAGTAVRLPATVQTAAEINAALKRPAR